MKATQYPENEIFYTSRHEWVRFQDNTAFIGVSNYRVAEEKSVKDIEFIKIFGQKEKGALLANIQFRFRTLQVYMPIAGKIIGINKNDLLILQNLLITDAEATGWLVKISIAESPLIMGLLTKENYRAQYPVTPIK
jgi:glycine cleavage system H protein